MALSLLKKLPFTFALFLFVCSCTNQENSSKSVLILSLESLSSSMINCIGEDKSYESEKLLCEEFVRFSHAYTSSPMAQSAIASILTGLYPYQHNVWNNGASFLSERFWTVSELAYDRSYRTSFFSGGGAVWRKSGLAQGFEVFDEFDGHKSGSSYRSISELSERWLHWLEDIPASQAFFSFLHITDTQFPTEKTSNEFGMERERSKDSQWREVLESMSSLFKDLKKTGRWDDTLIILVGINGGTPLDRESEISAIDLHSDNMQVSLFIKPPRKQRDKGLNWTIDQNVSLVDIGASLFEFLGQKKVNQGLLRSYSLVNAIENNKVDWPEDRPILLESGWAQWQNLSNTRSAILIKNKLFYNIEPMIYYNTLIDRRESIPVQVRGNLKLEEFQFVQSLFNKAGLDVWQGLDFFELRKMKLGQILWREGMDEHLYNELRMLAPRLPSSLQVAGWLAYHSLKEQNWERLVDLAKAYGVQEWDYVARRNLGKNLHPPKESSVCFLKLLPKNKTKKKWNRKSDISCDDEDVDALLSWRTKSGDESIYWRERFLKSYGQRVADIELSQKNYIAGLTWDIDLKKSLGPNDVELFLYLPENKKTRSIVEKRIDAGLFVAD